MTAVLPILTTVMSVMGSLSSAKAESNAAKYNASIASQNAKIANEQAASQAEQQRISNYRKLGSIRANYGAAGVTSDGSPMDVLADSYTQGEYDVQSIIYQGKVRAAGYQNTAALDTAAASNAKKSGYINAASSALLGGKKALDSAGMFD
jgi:hypothetical protein